jgi:hypothetical protein
MRWNYLTARTSFWLSFPMLFFMGAASIIHFSAASRDEVKVPILGQLVYTMG